MTLTKDVPLQSGYSGDIQAPVSSKVGVEITCVTCYPKGIMSQPSLTRYDC